MIWSYQWERAVSHKLDCTLHFYFTFILMAHCCCFFQARGKKRQIGWFPANYVKLLSPSTSKTTPTEPNPPKLPTPNAGTANLLCQKLVSLGTDEMLSFVLKTFKAIFKYIKFEHVASCHLVQVWLLVQSCTLVICLHAIISSVFHSICMSSWVINKGSLPHN